MVLCYEVNSLCYICLMVSCYMSQNLIISEMIYVIQIIGWVLKIQVKLEVEF